MTQDYIPSNNKHFYDGLFGFHPLAASDLTGEEQVVRRVVGRQAVVVVAAADVNLKTRWTGYWKKRKNNNNLVRKLTLKSRIILGDYLAGI